MSTNAKHDSIGGYKKKKEISHNERQIVDALHLRNRLVKVFEEEEVKVYLSSARVCPRKRQAKCADQQMILPNQNNYGSVTWWIGRETTVLGFSANRWPHHTWRNNWVAFKKSSILNVGFFLFWQIMTHFK